MDSIDKAYRRLYAAYSNEQDPARKARLDRALDTLANIELLRPAITF